MLELVLNKYLHFSVSKSGLGENSETPFVCLVKLYCYAVSSVAPPSPLHTNLPYICCQLGQAQTAVSIQGSERSTVTPDLSVIHSDAMTRRIQRGLTKVMYVKFVANYWHDGSIDDPLQLSGCLYQSLSYVFSCCSAPSPSACSHRAHGCFIVPENLRVQSTG